ncbi:MAG: sodium-dependent transporter [Streptosporangiales bacterium]|nr:sodium-dependent transporter [Streptosporangiales bacterium]
MTGSAVAADGRERWGSKVGFMLAAAGSAVGLGNIWRFPAVTYENGGGAFIIPYLVALVTAALPILMLEYGLGHRYRAGAPFTFRQIRRRWEWLGWWQTAVSFLVVTYYVTILGWCLSYMVYSFGTQWGDDPAGFFIGSFLGTSADGDPSGFWQFGGLQLKVLLAVAIAWLLVYAILMRRVSKGIELAAKVFMPLLVVLLLIIVIRGITLPGAAVGLDVLFTPDFAALGNPAVWIAAYGQVFFSTSIAFGTMIAYSSYLQRKTDLTNSAAVVGLSNSGFEILAAVGVFSVLGFLANASGAQVTDVVESGVGLAFIAFPAIINELPGLNSLFGVLFFGALFIAGITSAVSILEPGIAAVREKFSLSRPAAVTILTGLAALISLLYVSKGGLFYLDTADRFLNNFGLVLCGLGEIVLVGWVARALNGMQTHLNATSYFKAGWWWKGSLLIITPLLLGSMTVYNLYTELTTRYEDYPLSGLIVIGWGAVVLSLAVAVLMQAVRKSHQIPSEG